MCRLGSCNGVCAYSEPIMLSRTITKGKQTVEIFSTAIAQAVKALAKGQMIFLQIRLIMLTSTSQSRMLSIGRRPLPYISLAHANEDSSDFPFYNLY